MAVVLTSDGAYLIIRSHIRLPKDIVGKGYEHKFCCPSYEDEGAVVLVLLKESSGVKQSVPGLVTEV